MSERILLGLRVLVVEDDKELATSVRAGLEAEGCDVSVCHDGGTGLRQAEINAFDLLLLDVKLPVLDGLEVTRRLRLQGVQIPIVLMTGLVAPEDVVKGLSAGADDYLSKPFDFAVLVARMQARVRAATAGMRGKLRFADLTVDTEGREAMRAGRKLDLTRTEFAILECLIRSAGRVVRRERILEHVWPGRDVSENNLDTYIRYLRQKVDAEGMPRLIHTERGTGYSLRDRGRR